MWVPEALPKRQSCKHLSYIMPKHELDRPPNPSVGASSVDPSIMAPGGMSLASTGTASLGGGSPLHVRPDSPTSVGHVKEHADHYSPKGGFSPKGGATAATSKPNGPVPTGGAAEVPAEEEGGLSLLSFTRSIVELQNSVVAWWERREKEERMRFKAAEDAKWKERKATLHRSTHEHELNAKKQKELVGEERLRQHAGWKDEEAERMALIAQRREEWTETAKSSVRYHGKEQDARIKAERNESTEGKVSRALGQPAM